MKKTGKIWLSVGVPMVMIFFAIGFLTPHAQQETSPKLQYVGTHCGPCFEEAQPTWTDRLNAVFKTR